MRSDIAAAFEESTRIAPDPGEVLAGIRAGIERRRIRAVRVRITAVVVVVLSLSILALRATQKDLVVADAPPPIRVGEWFTSVELEYVPLGMTLQRHERSDVAETIEWSDGTNYVHVRVDNVDRERNLNLPGWEQTTMFFTPGRIYLRPGVVHLVQQLPSGRWVTFSLRLDGRSQSEMENMLRLTFGQLREKAGMRLSGDFAPAYLPAGHRIIGVGIEAPVGNGFGTIITATGSLQPRELEQVPIEPELRDQRRRPDLGRSLYLAFVKELWTPSPDVVQQLPDIGGRPAYVYHLDRPQLVVRDFHGGVLVIGNLAVDAEPLDELIKVAEGMRSLR